MHKVGDAVWVFNANRRVYRKDENGRSVGGPIFREHFLSREIVDETSRSWLVGLGRMKVPKIGGDVREGVGGVRVYMTQEAVDAAVYRHDHRHKIARAIETCADVAVLRQVAALVGYKAEE